jgi:hypothetical protein
MQIQATTTRCTGTQAETSASGEGSSSCRMLPTASSTIHRVLGWRVCYLYCLPVSPATPRPSTGAVAVAHRLNNAIGDQVQIYSRSRKGTAMVQLMQVPDRIWRVWICGCDGWCVAKVSGAVEPSSGNAFGATEWRRSGAGAAGLGILLDRALWIPTRLKRN